MNQSIDFNNLFLGPLHVFRVVNLVRMNWAKRPLECGCTAECGRTAASGETDAISDLEQKQLSARRKTVTLSETSSLKEFKTSENHVQDVLDNLFSGRITS